VGPFEAHLREALELNRHRAPIYHRSSNGRSAAISRRLIRSELLLLPLARWFDWRGRRYHRAGIPVLQEMFVTMESVGPAASLPGPHRHRRVVPPPPASLRRDIWRAYRTGGWEGARDAAQRSIDAIERNQGVDCMVRHLLESARRIAEVAPVAVEESARLALPSPAGLLRSLLRLHLWGLTPAARLDRDALPLQQAGIPLLCADVPPIPAWRGLHPGRGQ
jgi:hypothetical protein